MGPAFRQFRPHCTGRLLYSLVDAVSRSPPRHHDPRQRGREIRSGEEKHDSRRFIDLEGVLYTGGYPLPGAREALLSLRAAGIPDAFRHQLHPA
jgi:hypothetical protein